MFSTCDPSGLKQYKTCITLFNHAGHFHYLGICQFYYVCCYKKYYIYAYYSYIQIKFRNLGRILFSALCAVITFLLVLILECL